MRKEFVEEVAQAVDRAIENEHYHAELFQYMERKQEKSHQEPLHKILLNQREAISRHLKLAGIQEPCSVRNVAEARELAKYLIRDDGSIDKERLTESIKVLTENLYSLGPERQHDGLRREHLLFVLQELSKEGDTWRLLRSLSKPVSLPAADLIIRETVGLSSKDPITDAHVRRAALSAWLCYLRQSVGSCFATAPAIIVHDEQPHSFLKDIQTLLATGRLKRTYGGVEHSVPLSSSWGVGDARRPLLMSPDPSICPAPLWHSPGLQAALESLGLIEPDLRVSERAECCKAWVIKALQNMSRAQSLFYTNCEQLIQHILLLHLELTKADIADYESRPQGMVHSGLLMTSASTKNQTGSKTDRCASYKQQVKQAIHRFISFADNPLLKAWEFTVASFAETKHEFTRWNLYSSLGLNYDQPGGIGYCLYSEIQNKLNYQNQVVEELQERYEVVYQTVIVAENRLKRAGSDQEARFLRSDYQNRASELRSAQYERDTEHLKAKKLADLYNYLIDKYVKLFQDYFQEVYDADMHDVAGGLYDDSPAGFRLLYTHGRDNTAQWSMIYHPQEFVDALSNFFVATENEVTADENLEGVERETSEIITTLVTHIKSIEFIESAFYRMAQAHKTSYIENPLENLERIDKKPWVYTSGGNMHALVSCYFRRESKPTEESRWMEEPVELLAFLVDTLRNLPNRISQRFAREPKRSMLIHSPTHAFLLKPGRGLYSQAWQDEEYSYTYIRDKLFLPRQRFVEGIKLDRDMIDRLLEMLEARVPLAYRVYVKQLMVRIPGRLSPMQFRRQMIGGIGEQRGLLAEGRSVLSADDVDALLYKHLPLFHRTKVETYLQELLAELPEMDERRLKRLMAVYHKLSPRVAQQAVVTSFELQSIAKSLLMIEQEGAICQLDYHLLIRTAAAKLGLAMPRPVIFADTNWVTDYFAFVVSPGTAEWELWRVDRTGAEGTPMSWWKKWLDGSQKKPDWGILTDPTQYRS